MKSDKSLLIRDHKTHPIARELDQSALKADWYSCGLPKKNQAVARRDGGDSFGAYSKTARERTDTRVISIREPGSSCVRSSPAASAGSNGGRCGPIDS